MMTETRSGYGAREPSGIWTLVRRMEEDPGYMAWVLAAYCRAEGWSPETLRDRLGLDDEALLRLVLCKRPQGDSPNFAAQVREIAEYTQVDAAIIARTVRTVDALQAMEPRHVRADEETNAAITPKVNPGVMFVAARDRLREAPQTYQDDLPPAVVSPAATPDAGAGAPTPRASTPHTEAESKARPLSTEGESPHDADQRTLADE